MEFLDCVRNSTRYICSICSHSHWCWSIYIACIAQSIKRAPLVHVYTHTYIQYMWVLYRKYKARTISLPPLPSIYYI